MNKIKNEQTNSATSWSAFLMIEVVGQRVMTVNLLDYTNKYGEKVLFKKTAQALNGMRPLYLTHDRN